MEAQVTGDATTEKTHITGWRVVSQTCRQAGKFAKEFLVQSRTMAVLSKIREFLDVVLGNLEMKSFLALVLEAVEVIIFLLLLLLIPLLSRHARTIHTDGKFYFLTLITYVLGWEKVVRTQ